MPWTNRQFRFLMSKGSPLSQEKKSSMVAEAHQNPGLIHKSKESAFAKAKRRHDGNRINR